MIFSTLLGCQKVYLQIQRFWEFDKVFMQQHSLFNGRKLRPNYCDTFLELYSLILICSYIY